MTTPNPSRFRIVGQALIIIVLMGLVISPIDLIPDMIPVVGYLDDVVYLIGAVVSGISLVKKIRAKKE